MVTDIRGGSLFGALADSLEKLRQEGRAYKLLFLDADDTVRINRFKETRRKHPLLDEEMTSLEEAIREERRILKPVQEMAHYMIDTSKLSPTQLRQRISTLFLGIRKKPCRCTACRLGSSTGCPPKPIWCLMCAVCLTRFMCRN